MAEKAYIVEAVRTAGGKRDGNLSLWHPADLGAKVLDEIVLRLDMDPALVDDVIFGCVDQVGAQSGNIARNAVLSSSFPGLSHCSHFFNNTSLKTDGPPNTLRAFCTYLCLNEYLTKYTA